MFRILVLFLSFAALSLSASAAVTCCSTGDDNVVVTVSCARVHHRISTVVNAGATGMADALQWSVHAITDCAKQAVSTACDLRKFAGSSIKSAENRLQDFSTEVISQSLQLLRNALSSLWALVLGLLRF